MLEILATNADLTRQTVFDNGWLDVEEAHRAAGWRVEYDKPAYNESYDAFFVFSKRRLQAVGCQPLRSRQSAATSSQTSTTSDVATLTTLLRHFSK